MSTALVPVPVSDVEKMAIAIAKSGLFGMKTPEQAMALMLIAQAEGMHPALAARDYHIIQGRPALKADAMLARFLSAGGKVAWDCYTDERVAATFSHEAGGTVGIEWTMARAKAANLTGKDVWKQYPRQMLRARVISEGVRTVYPNVTVGIYTPEELDDVAPERSAARAKPVEARVEVLSASIPDAVVEHFAARPTADTTLSPPDEAVATIRAQTDSEALRAFFIKLYPTMADWPRDDVARVIAAKDEMKAKLGDG